MSDYGMQTDEGNARVQEIVDDVLATPLDSTGFIRIAPQRRPERLLTREEYAGERLATLALTPEFVEADTHRVWQHVRKALS